VAPCYLIMGVFGPAVDYLTVKKVREAVMNCTHTETVINSYLTTFGYTTTDAVWVVVPAAGGTVGADGGAGGLEAREAREAAAGPVDREGEWRRDQRGRGNAHWRDQRVRGRRGRWTSGAGGTRSGGTSGSGGAGSGGGSAVGGSSSMGGSSATGGETSGGRVGLEVRVPLVVLALAAVRREWWRPVRWRWRNIRRRWRRGTGGAATSAASAAGGSPATGGTKAGGGTTASPVGGSDGNTGPAETAGTKVGGANSGSGCAVAGGDRRVTRWGAIAGARRRGGGKT